jgi:hypothetical protein
LSYSRSPLFPLTAPWLQTMTGQSAPRKPLPHVKFRVLIAGRANAGKTSILQRVCDTTESPKVYRITFNELGNKTRKEVRPPSHESNLRTQRKIDSPRSYVRGMLRCVSTEPCQFCFSQRGQHNISDELEFSNHKGNVFHDSRGLESGNASELQTLQEFVRERSGRKSFKDRLHAIWSVLIEILIH